MGETVAVVKYGSSVLANRGRLPAVVHDIYRLVRRGRRVLAVVSAIGDRTDELLAAAGQFGGRESSEAALAKLLATGEEQSAALLSLAANQAGIPCTLLDVETLRLIAKGERLDADPYSLNRRAIELAFRGASVVVVPGFVGRYEHGGSALMGRGGSDLTAVFIADQIRADVCRLVKDVDGIYEHDPADLTVERAPRRFADVTYDDALRVAGVLVQPKAVEYLSAVNRTAVVTSLLHDRGTVVGAPQSRLAGRSRDQRLTVALVGLGTVGTGVYRHLSALSSRFAIAGVAVRHGDRDRSAHDGDLVDSADALFERPFDVLVDVSGDTQAAFGWVERCLQSGRPAVTTDKQLVARHGIVLAETANRYGTEFRYSAAVGGAVPMLETVERVKANEGIQSIRGVLSGTCNYIVDRMAAGRPYAEALAEARNRGLAEADPSRDLSGADSVDKLRLLARAAWGPAAGSGPIVCDGIEALTREQIVHARKKHRRIRLVASMTAGGHGVVQPQWLFSDDALATVTGSGNMLELRSTNGKLFMASGRGAGCWPTAEAVLGDLIDLGEPVFAAGAKPASRAEPRLPRLPEAG